MKGIVKTTTAIPQGIYKIVIGTHEGFVNLPTLYGSEVRKSGPVKGIASGIKEAGKVCYNDHSMFYTLTEDASRVSSTATTMVSQVW